jgi:hypothetical protein
MPTSSRSNTKPPTRPPSSPSSAKTQSSRSTLESKSSDELKKSLRLAPIQKQMAIDLLNRSHPLGAGSISFTLAVGVFWEGRLAGVLTYGCPIVNHAAHAFGLKQAEVFELRKMWLSDSLPKNSESRALGIAAMLIRKHYPGIRLLLTYCDGTERASAYLAAGWRRFSVARHVSGYVMPDGTTISTRTANRRQSLKTCQKAGKPIVVEKAKLVLPLDSTLKIQFSCAGSVRGDTPAIQAGEGGSSPTPALQLQRSAAAPDKTGTGAPGASAGRNRMAPRTKET